MDCNFIQSVVVVVLDQLAAYSEVSLPADGIIGMANLGINAIASVSETYRAQLLALVQYLCNCPCARPSLGKK